MPKLSEALTTLTVGGKKFQNPEWWSSKHKLTREVKRENSTKEIIQRLTPKIGGQLEVVTLEKQPSADIYVRQMQTMLDSEKYNEFAPWSPIHRKTKVIFINRK